MTSVTASTKRIRDKGVLVIKMCLKLCPCAKQEKSHAFNEGTSTIKDGNNMMNSTSSDTAANSSCVCPRKRKEHDDSPDSCCKSSKPSEPPTKVNTSVDTFIRSWMLPMEVTEKKEEDWNRGERWNSVQRDEKIFVNERRKKKSSSSSKSKQLAKKIFNLQEKIIVAEHQLEEKVGHPLSKADKLKDEKLGNLMRERMELRKEQKDLKEKEPKEGPRSTEEIRNMIEANMEKLRKTANRTSSLDEMSLAELEDEKNDLMEQLDLVEGEVGSLARKGNRQALTALFSRLRLLKRSTRRPSEDSREFLEDIPEHEAFQVVTPCRSRRPSLDSTGGEEEQEEEEQEQDVEEEEEGEWHTMTEGELLVALKEMREEKRSLRRLIQEFEQGVQAKTYRKISREDKEPYMAVYKSYKTIKSRMKLVDALLFKYNIINASIN